MVLIHPQNREIFGIYDGNKKGNYHHAYVILAARCCGRCAAMRFSGGCKDAGTTKVPRRWAPLWCWRDCRSSSDPSPSRCRSASPWSASTDLLVRRAEIRLPDMTGDVVVIGGFDDIPDHQFRRRVYENSSREPSPGPFAGEYGEPDIEMIVESSQGQHQPANSCPSGKGLNPAPRCFQSQNFQSPRKWGNCPKRDIIISTQIVYPRA